MEKRFSAGLGAIKARTKPKISRSVTLNLLQKRVTPYAAIQ